MSRLKKLETYYKDQLKNHNINDVSDFIQSILNADITKGKYARFLIEAFLNDKFLEEDLIGSLNSTVGQAISFFDKHKGKLPVHERSVYALNPKTSEALYQSPGDLWNSVKQYQGELSGKELKKEEQEKIYRETEFVYKDEETGFQIISPLTKESAKWWGKGTRWCTSAENNNMFWDYAKDAPLFILLMPDKQKLQLWKDDNSIVFMDESDNSVSREYIEQHWSVLEPICLWLKKYEFIPYKNLNYDLYSYFLEQGKISSEIVPKKIQDYELAKKIIKNEKNLKNIRKDLIDTELCKTISFDDDNFKDIPKNIITKELCELAVEHNGLSLKYIPKEYITKKLCQMAIQQNGMALLYVPENIITLKLCELSIRKNSENLQYVPDNFRTSNICKLSIEDNPYTILEIPENQRTKEMYELAVKKDGTFLKYVPEKYKTLELCELAVRQNGYNIVFRTLFKCFTDIG